MRNEIITQPNWKNKKLKVYLEDPENEIWKQFRYNIKALRGSKQKFISNVIIPYTIQYNQCRKIRDIICHSFNFNLKKRFFVYGVDQIYMSYTGDNYFGNETHLLLEYIEIKESFLSYIMQSKLLINNNIIITNEFKKELVNLFSMIGNNDENVTFEKHLDAWAKRLLYIPQKEANNG